ncbi:MAG: MATE family efflux transporter [Oscillospiraceae bacterium]|nr:MATE family efflux transporter [Oscillospiraceae bacterium]
MPHSVASQNRMTEGSISGKLIRFAFPLFLGNLFQQLYNVADTLIVGNFLGPRALAAVSSTGSLIFLLISLFGGIAAGGGVVISRFFGARDVPALRRAVHTAVAFGLSAGALVTAAGVLLTPQLLVWMGTPEEVLPLAVTYVRTFFAGAVGLVLYNTCMGIMQAVGDSRHPLQYLILSSCLNVSMDLLMIGVFHLGVFGAALATIVAQFISAALCLARLLLVREEYRVSLREVRFDPTMLRMILRYGLPSGLQNSIIALANVVVQSNINAFGEMAMAGCGAYARVEGFAFLPITSFTMALTTFVGQNLGAREFDRAKRGARFGILCAVGLAEAVGVVIYLLAPLLIGAFTDEAAAIAFGVQKARTCALFFCLLAASHCCSAVLRGAGRAVVPMVTMLAFWCVLRVSFLTVMVPIVGSIAVVNWVYPLTWGCSTVALLIYYLRVDWLHGFEREKHQKTSS